jgi:hypothetical protein
LSLGRRRLAQGRCRRCSYVGLRTDKVEWAKTDGHRADAEPVPNLLVPQIGGDQRHNVPDVSGSFRQTAHRRFGLRPSSPANGSGLGRPDDRLLRAFQQSLTLVITGCPACAGHDTLVMMPLIIFHRAKLHRSGRAGARPPLGMSPIRGGKAPTSAGAERRTRWLSLAAKPVPSAEGNSRPITRTGAPIGASPRRFP